MLGLLDLITNVCPHCAGNYVLICWESVDRPRHHREKYMPLPRGQKLVKRLTYACGGCARKVEYNEFKDDTYIIRRIGA